MQAEFESGQYVGVTLLVDHWWVSWLESSLSACIYITRYGMNFFHTLYCVILGVWSIPWLFLLLKFFIWLHLSDVCFYCSHIYNYVNHCMLICRNKSIYKSIYLPHISCSWNETSYVYSTWRVKVQDNVKYFPVDNILSVTPTDHCTIGMQWG